MSNEKTLPVEKSIAIQDLLDAKLDGYKQVISEIYYGCSDEFITDAITKLRKPVVSMSAMEKKLKEGKSEQEIIALDKERTFELTFDFTGVKVNQLMQLMLKTSTPYKLHYNGNVYNHSDSEFLRSEKKQTIMVIDLLTGKTKTFAPKLTYNSKEELKEKTIQILMQTMNCTREAALKFLQE